MKLVLKDKKKDGTYNVKFLLVHNQRNSYLKSNYYVRKNQFRNGRVVNHDLAKNYNLRLGSLMSDYEIKLDDILHKVDLMSVLEIKMYLTSKFDKSRIDFLEYTDELISKLRGIYRRKLAREGKASKRTFESYVTLRNHIETFAGPSLEVTNIDKYFLENFEAYLRDLGVKNGIWNYMKDLRTIINKLIQDEYIDKYPFRFYNLGRLKKNIEPKTLEVSDLVKLFGCQVKNEHEKLALDVFMLDFYLIGINSVDLYHIENGGGKIENGRIYFKRSKTDVIHSIKIEPEAQIIIDRLRGKEKYFVFQEKYNNSSNLTKNINKFLKIISEQKLTLGFARYTWATIAYNECDISESVIDFSLGHKSKSLAGVHYIKKRRGLMDEANRKVIDYVKTHF